MATLETIIAEDKPDLIIPCRDDDVQWLAANKAQLLERDVYTLTGDEQSASPLADKWQSAIYASRHELPFVPSAPADRLELVEELVRSCGFPLLVKPRSGFASGGVRILTHSCQLELVLGNVSLLVQQYLSPADHLRLYMADLDKNGIPLFHSFEEEKISCQAFICPQGMIRGSIVTRHVMRQGQSVKVELFMDPEAIELGLRIATSFALSGWRGPINSQCQYLPGFGFQIYEFNGRFTGATSARALLGYDEVGMALHWFAGFPETVIASSARMYNSAVVRTPHSTLLCPRDDDPHKTT